MDDIEELTIQAIMSSTDSRKFICDYLHRCGVFGSTFDKDPIEHSFKAGLREAGLQLENDIKDAAPDAYLMMMKEYIDG